MRKRTQLNIEIDDDLLKSLKLLAIQKNIKLNALVKEILSEKINLNNLSEIDMDVLDELKKLKKRISKLEQS
jgi:predicted DNA-binding ribbon-helix-helix protein